ncbi:hypothetical protein [Gynurincola endophyticus]|uniref:hypothetical protein n=1 Tax=Gynurincola endophyticus TaxID=2479004 RepID=UPI000F8C7ED8|nr:hypothetical protein [Gynurincola endophyticus]
MKRIFIYLSIALVSWNHMNAQCVPPQAAPVVDCGTGTLLTDGANINSGQVFYTNGGGPYQNVNLNGGTLVLCGTVTFNSINYNSGTLIIKENADVTFSGSYNSGGNHWFYNYGNVTFNLPVQVSGNSTFVYNAQNATINVNGNMAVLNGGLFINNGTTIVQNVLLNSGANVCLGNQSIVNMTSFTNNQTNAVSVGSGSACVSYSGTFGGNNPVTASSGLRICQLAGASAPAPAVVGTAVFTQNCGSCISILPVTLEYFRGKMSGNQVQLEWKTSMEENVAVYHIQQSVNQSEFTTVAEVAANNQPSSYQYSLNLTGPVSLRLKIVDIDDQFSYSNIIALRPNVANMSIKVKTNPVTGGVAQVHILAAKREQGQIRLVDQSGAVRLSQPVQLNEGENNIRINMQSLAAGAYYIIYEGGSGKTAPVAVMKQ